MEKGDRPGEKIDFMEEYKGLAEGERNELRDIIKSILGKIEDPQIMFDLIGKVIDSQRKVAYMEGLSEGYLNGLRKSLEELNEIEISAKRYPM